MAASTPTTIAITLTTPAQQPTSLWDNGTVLVAGITFVGVVLTLIAAHYRMHRELRAAAIEANVEREQTRAQADLDRKHAALEAHKERLATTRRQVYLEAVEALAKAQMFLGGLAKQDLAKLESSQGLGPLQIAVNRVAVVGEMETVRKARELTSLMNQRFIKAIIQLLPLGVAKSSAVFHHTQWEATQAEIARLLAMMTNHNETQKHDPVGFATLTRNMEAQQAKAARHAKGEQEAYASIIQHEQAYLAFVAEGGKQLALMLDDLADCVRRELSIDTDLEEFRAQTHQMLAAMDAAVEEMKAGIKAFQAVSA